MKALSVRQPFASQIASGEKTVELRSWSTKFRGPLLIVASARPGPDKDLRRGGTVCVVDVVDVVEATRQHFADACCPLERGEQPTGYAWLLSKPRHVTFLAVKGKLGLYNFDGDL